MSEIKRWDYDYLAGGPTEDAEGNYVLHSDHEAEVARLRAELADAHAAIESKAGWEWKKEADRLRAEVEENEKVINVWRRRTERAEAEADALGPDAMRWRHVRDMDPDAVGPAHHVVECGSDSWGNPYYEYVTGEEADQVIDAAMGASA